jgi:hypothetical protein
VASQAERAWSTHPPKRSGETLICVPGSCCPEVASRILVADLNGDQAPDLFVGAWNSAKSYIWFGKKATPKP